MKELMEYREKLIARLGEAAQEFYAICKAATDPHQKAAGEWSIHQFAAHTRDVDQVVYGRRFRRTLNEEQPMFQNFDADVWMAENYKAEEPLDSILDGLLASVDEMCQLLNAMPQAGWSRLSRHETLGNELTLQLWVERDLAHIEEHVKVLKKG